MSAKLGEILVRENLITAQQLREALEYQRQSGGRLGSNLVKLGFISDDVITAVLSRQYGVPSINLELFQIDEETINLISHRRVHYIIQNPVDTESDAKIFFIWLDVNIGCAATK